jgi:hypothetical protein
MSVGPSGDVAGGKDTRHAHGQSGLFRDRQRRPDADADDKEVAVERDAAAERHRPPVNPSHGLAEVECHAVRLVQRADEASHLGAHDPFEWGALRRDDIDGDTAGPQ